MSDLRKYFLEAQEEANESFFNYDGYDYFDDYDDFDDDYFEGDDDFDMASGSSAPTSQPYIIVIKNTATATAQIPHVDISSSLFILTYFRVPRAYHSIGFYYF